MKPEPGPDMVIMGSGTIVAQLTDAQTDRRVSDRRESPSCWGGTDAVRGVQEGPLLERTNTRVFENGNVVLWYEPTG